MQPTAKRIFPSIAEKQVREPSPGTIRHSITYAISEGDFGKPQMKSRATACPHPTAPKAQLKKHRSWPTLQTSSATQAAKSATLVGTRATFDVANPVGRQRSGRVDRLHQPEGRRASKGSKNLPMCSRRMYGRPVVVLRTKA